MTTENRPTRFAAGVVIAAAIALAFMIAWSAVHWPEMAPTIVTREAGGSHGASIIPRGFSASAMPVILVLVSSLMAISPWVNTKFSSPACQCPATTAVPHGSAPRRRPGFA